MTDKTISRTLAISLALNILLVGGTLGGGLVWLYEIHKVQPRRTVQGLLAAAQALQPEQRQTFRQSLQKARRGAVEKIGEGQRAREDLARLLSQDPLDRNAIDITLEKIRNADISLRTSVEAAVVDFAATLSSDDRAKFIEGLESHGQILRRRQNN